MIEGGAGQGAFTVVKNHEVPYSIGSADKCLPERAGVWEMRFAELCLEEIEGISFGMKLPSLRRLIEASAG